MMSSIKRTKAILVHLDFLIRTDPFVESKIICNEQTFLGPVVLVVSRPNYCPAQSRKQLKSTFLTTQSRRKVGYLTLIY